MSSRDLSGENLIYDIRLSSVVPGRITAEDKRRYDLTNMDLIMKLHYLTTVQFFDKEAVDGLSIQDLKNPMFGWLELYYPICGRMRRSDGGGRPYVKCNDGGVRIVEAKCSKTVAEWRQEIGDHRHNQLLVYSQHLADDFGFTPLVFLQFTEFKCGGICVGMSWAHVLGDAFSALQCINIWGNMITKNQKPQLIYKTPTKTQKATKNLDPPSSFPRSVKLLDPLRDQWIIHNTCKMQNHTFHVSEKLLNEYLVKSAGEKISDYKGLKPFELISAVVWKSLAKVRGVDQELKIVTLCKKGCHKTGEDEVLCNRNDQVIGIVDATTTRVAEANPLDLAVLIVGNFVEETETVEKLMEEGEGKLDFMVYGASLTFVDLEEVDLYAMEVRGQQPIFANLSIEGVGDGGAVVVLPSGAVNGGGGRILNVILPEFELQGLKHELGVEWGIF